MSLKYTTLLTFLSKVRCQPPGSVHELWIITSAHRRDTKWRLWLYFNSDGQVKKDSFLWEWVRFMGPVLAAGPTSSLICFYSNDPWPSGVIREPPNGPAGCQPISHCLFSNQITIFNGDTSPGPSPNTHLFEIVPRNYCTQKLSLCTPHTPHFGLLFVVCFQPNLPSGLLMDRNQRGWWGRGPGSWRRSQRRIGKAARAFWFSTKQVFHSEHREQLSLSGGLHSASSHDDSIKTVSEGLLRPGGSMDLYTDSLTHDLGY